MALRIPITTQGRKTARLWAKWTLLHLDQLGFDHMWDALSAVATHADYAERWDIRDEKDIAILDHFRLYHVKRS